MRETKKCQNCQKEFQIEPEDFAFYEKIKVPPPTWCPECRLIRKIMFRNERSLYKRTCDLCKKKIISMYRPNTLFPVFCLSCWWSDKWDPLSYGIEYDWDQPFFSQFFELYNKVPRLMFNQYRENIGCECSNFLISNKNVYLSYSITDCEDIAYSNIVDKSRNCLDSFFLKNSEKSYWAVEGSNIYECMFVFQCRDCINSTFLFDCANCQNCFMSKNLRNKYFVFRNEQLTKEEYEKKIATVNTGSYKIIFKLIKEYSQMINEALHRYANIVKSVDCSGDSISNCRNAKNCFNINNSEYVKYFIRGFEMKEGYDIYGAGRSELLYEGFASGYGDSRVYFFSYVDVVRDSTYVDLCRNISNLFGCIGLRNKQYCILNKQYTKEEYERLIPKIIEHMNSMPYIDKKGRVYKYGEFFPPELSPFAYNETIAQEYFSLTKKQALAQGYSWKDQEERDIKIDIKTEDLPDHIHPPKFCKAKLGRVKDVLDSIVGQVIECAHKGECNEQCTTAFKIIPQELQFYRRMNLPLPRLCPNCRHYQRIKQRNPLKLWKRKCMCGGQKSSNGVYANTATHFHGNNPCPNEFETSYAPERKEIVYCEKCYLLEVV